MSFNQSRWSAGNRLVRSMTPEEENEFKQLQKMAYEYDNYALPLFPSLYTIAPQSTKISQLECIPIIGNLVVFYIICKFIVRTTNVGSIGGITFMTMLGYSVFMLITGFVPFINVWIAYKTRPLYRCWQVFSAEVDNRGLYHGGVANAGLKPEYMSSLLRSSGMHHLATPPTGHTPVRAVPYSENQTKALKAIPPMQAIDKHYSMDSAPKERRGFSSFIPMQHQNKPYPIAPTETDYDANSTRRHSFESTRASILPDEADFIKTGYAIRQSHLDNWPLK
ncbi:hypothetical protein LPJ64_003435 [Coemansia asiatica]|uniref:Uncharacterized protein n=1 Tax=Coemansia asiatica TaxID=1052880 RepID=A0A9W7XL03_9FUNG|nr:hypothetical protein LPJ64_003435 [Coemansia asiatica]